MRRSPIFSHLSLSLNGITLIRASNAEELLIAEFDRILNFHTSSLFTKLATMRWFVSAMIWITWGRFMTCEYHYNIISKLSSNLKVF